MDTDRNSDKLKSVIDYREVIMRYFLGATVFGLGALCFNLFFTIRTGWGGFEFELISVISAVICSAIFAGLLDKLAQSTYHLVGLWIGIYLTISSFILGCLLFIIFTAPTWHDYSFLEMIKAMFYALFGTLAFGSWIMIFAFPFGALSGWGYFYLRRKAKHIIQKYVAGLSGIVICGVIGLHTWAQYLHHVIKKGNETTVARIPQLELLLNVKNLKTGDAPLHRAISEGQYNIAMLLLKKGAAIDQKDKWGQTPLRMAAIRLDTTMIQFLLQGGANVEATDDQGETPLIMAVGSHPFEKQANHLKSVELLLEHGANPNHRNKRQETALHKAMDSQIVHLLLEYGADPNAQEFEGQTPLQKVAEAGRLETVKVLLAAGADPNIKDNYGNTPLHDAWTVDVARLLLNAGAQLNVTNQKGRAPAEEIRVYGRRDVAIFLESLQNKKIKGHDELLICQYSGAYYE